METIGNMGALQHKKHFSLNFAMISLHLQPQKIDTTEIVAKVHSHVPLQRAGEPLEELGSLGRQTSAERGHCGNWRFNMI
jgi:hypothetical protein